MHPDDVTPFWTVRCTLSDALCNENQDFVVIVTGSNDVVIRFDDSINGGNGDVARVSTKNSSPSAVAQLMMIDNLPVLQLTALGGNLDVVMLRKNHVQRVVNRGSGHVTIDENILVTNGTSLTVSANGSGDIRVKSSSKLTVDELSLSSQGSGRIHALFSDVNVKSVLIQVLSSGDIAMLTNSTSVESSMSLSVLGSGSLCVSSMETDRLKIKKVGTGDISLGPRGSCEDAEVSTGGSGTIDIGGIQCHNVNIDLLGSGNVVVQATNSLTGDVYGSGHLKYYGEAPQSIDNVNYMGLVTAMPVSSTYHPAECKVKSFSPLKPTDSTSNSPSRPGDDEEFNYDLTNDKSNIIYLAGVVFLVALILRWFNESRRRTREEQRQPLVGAERRVYV